MIFVDLLEGRGEKSENFLIFFTFCIQQIAARPCNLANSPRVRQGLSDRFV
jgi:hypothetical protein